MGDGGACSSCLVKRYRVRTLPTVSSTVHFFQRSVDGSQAVLDRLKGRRLRRPPEPLPSERGRRQAGWQSRIRSPVLGGATATAPFCPHRAFTSYWPGFRANIPRHHPTRLHPQVVRQPPCQVLPLQSGSSNERRHCSTRQLPHGPLCLRISPRVIPPSPNPCSQGCSQRSRGPLDLRQRRSGDGCYPSSALA